MPPLVILARHVSGFEIHVAVSSLDELDAAIVDLQRRDCRPTSGSADGWQRTPEGLPLCPKHGVPMRARLKQGDEWHSHSVVDTPTDEVLYCRGYRSPSSPGYELSGDPEARP
jgi:hypothetical protein